MINQEPEYVGFTDEEIKPVNPFEPQKTKQYLNDLFTKKVEVIVGRIETMMKQRYCTHKQQHLDWNKTSDTVLCLECDREWE
jgi:hypothetical protein